jgi:hypothetical protein
VPDEELTSIQRVCFQIEQVHWFYEDFIREENSKLPSKNLKSFSLMLFQSCPLLQHWAADHEQAFTTFMEYKIRVPVCGAIILNADLNKLLLVRGFLYYLIVVGKRIRDGDFPKEKSIKEKRKHHVLFEKCLRRLDLISANTYAKMSILKGL